MEIGTGILLAVNHGQEEGDEKKVKNEICAGLRRPDLAETRDDLD